MGRTVVLLSEPGRILGLGMGNRSFAAFRLWLTVRATPYMDRTWRDLDLRLCRVLRPFRVRMRLRNP